MKLFTLPKAYVRTKGFTLVETLVSTMIISLVILGPLTVASNASVYARITKDTLTATYLAQEAIELLHHQQDSIYIRCAQEAGSFCVPTGTESYTDAAWRIFKDRFDSTSGVSCFSDENPSGCSYDFIDMTTNEAVTPTKYISTNSSCSSLSIQTATHLYVCSSVHSAGGGYTSTSFSRSVSITSVPTFGSGTAEQDYFDDLRVAATVSFRRPNGFIYQVKVVDFLHARS
jgi:prepilin-type N-terminal cleavage/methylation domain-containing protein